MHPRAWLSSCSPGPGRPSPGQQLSHSSLIGGDDSPASRSVGLLQRSSSHGTDSRDRRQHAPRSCGSSVAAARRVVTPAAEARSSCGRLVSRCGHPATRPKLFSGRRSGSVAPPVQTTGRTADGTALRSRRALGLGVVRPLTPERARGRNRCRWDARGVPYSFVNFRLDALARVRLFNGRLVGMLERQTANRIS